MAGDTKERVIKIRVDASGAAKGLKDVVRSLKKTESSVQKLQRAIGQLSGAMKGLGIGIAAIGFGKTITDTLSFASSIKDTAELVGFSTDALQELRFAASEVGVDMRVLDGSLQRFTRRVGEASRGTGLLGKEFEIIGINIRDSNGQIKDSETLLNEYADAVQSAGTNSEQLLRVQRALDIEGATLSGIFKDGAAGLEKMRQKARDTGQVLSEELINKGAEIDGAFTDAIGAIATTLKVIILESLSALNEVRKAVILMGLSFGKIFNRIGASIEIFVLRLGAVGNVIREFISGLFSGGSEKQRADIFERLAQDTKKVNDELKDNIKTLDGALRLAGEDLNTRKKTVTQLKEESAAKLSNTEASKKSAKSIQDSIVKLKEQEKQLGKNAGEVVRLNAEVKRSERLKGIGQLSGVSQEEIQRQIQLADSERDLTVAIFQKGEALKESDKKQQEANKAIEKNKDLTKQQVANFEGVKLKLKSNIGSMKNQVSLLGETEQAIQRNTAARRRLNQELQTQADFEAGKLTAQQASELDALAVSQENVTNNAADTTRAFEKQASVVDDLNASFENFTKSSGNAITEFVTGAKADFGTLISSFIKDLIKLQIQQQLTSAVSGISGGFGGLVAGLFSGATVATTPQGGGVVATPSLVGTVTAKGATIAGEAGPEAILPLTRGKGGNLGVRSIGGSGSGVTVNVINQSKDSEATTTERKGANGQRIIDVMIQSVVNKGLTSGAFDRSLGGTFGLSRRGAI